MGTIRDLRAGRSNQPWVEFLDNEIATTDSQTARHAIVKIFRRSLFSARGCLPSDAALQIDAYYEDIYLASNPALKDQDDKGMVEFLTGLYGVVSDLVLIIPYHHGLQYAIIDLLFELRNLPSRKIRIDNVRGFPLLYELLTFTYTGAAGGLRCLRARTRNRKNDEP